MVACHECGDEEGEETGECVEESIRIGIGTGAGVGGALGEWRSRGRFAEGRGGVNGGRHGCGGLIRQPADFKVRLFFPWALGCSILTKVLLQSSHARMQGSHGQGFGALIR
jgi:hypothetical protein